MVYSLYLLMQDPNIVPYLRRRWIKSYQYTSQECVLLLPTENFWLPLIIIIMNKWNSYCAKKISLYTEDTKVWGLSSIKQPQQMLMLSSCLFSIAHAHRYILVYYDISYKFYFLLNYLILSTRYVIILIHWVLVHPIKFLCRSFCAQHSQD